jgi:hypothetical protein
MTEFLNMSYTNQIAKIISWSHSVENITALKPLLIRSSDTTKYVDTSIFFLSEIYAASSLWGTFVSNGHVISRNFNANSPMLGHLTAFELHDITQNSRRYVNA